MVTVSFSAYNRTTQKPAAGIGLSLDGFEAFTDSSGLVMMPQDYPIGGTYQLLIVLPGGYEVDSLESNLGDLEEGAWTIPADWPSGMTVFIQVNLVELVVPPNGNGNGNGFPLSNKTMLLLLVGGYVLGKQFDWF